MINKEQLEAIGKLTALATFMFSVFTYWNNIYTERNIKKYDFSINIIKEYTDNIRAKERDLEDVRIYYGNISNTKTFPDIMFKAIADEILFDYIEGRPKKEQHKKPRLKMLLEINDFYERSYFCVTKGICSFDIVTEYTCPKALNFYQKYQRLFDYYNDKWDHVSLNNQENTLIQLCGKGQ